MHPFLESIVAKFPEAVISAEQDPVRGDLWAQVKVDQWRHVAQFLHDDPRLALDHITDICSADFPDDAERFEVSSFLLDQLPIVNSTFQGDFW